ncbi:MAG: enoyl-ACP reductase [Actinobacteria bacterium]|jgi:enoyl-[acyl-carrier protein] reductase I|nr:enoyl-ACP reductase [Actinomycetota bacterium]
MLEGKLALIAGVANKRSIAWGIAEELHRQGAKLAFTYQGERVEKNVRDLAATVGSDICVEMDARDDASIKAAFDTVVGQLGGLDILVHSIAFAQAHDLQQRFIETKREDFWLAVDVSAYSLVAMAREAEPHMEARGGGSIVTMTYLGGERAVPGYNVMGVAKSALDSSMRYLAADLGPKNIRVNAVSAGPVRTLAGRSIPGFTTMEELVLQRSPLQRNVDQGDVGKAAAYLLDAENVTGTVAYVDAGYHAMGL